jgi:hypothetical protein
MKKLIKNKFLQIFILIIFVAIIIYFFNYKEGNSVNCKDKNENSCNKNSYYCKWRTDQERICNQEARIDNEVICKKWTMVDSSKCVKKV